VSRAVADLQEGRSLPCVEELPGLQLLTLQPAVAHLGRLGWGPEACGTSPPLPQLQTDQVRQSAGLSLPALSVSTCGGSLEGHLCCYRTLPPFSRWLPSSVLLHGSWYLPKAMCLTLVLRGQMTDTKNGVLARLCTARCLQCYLRPVGRLEHALVTLQVSTVLCTLLQGKERPAPQAADACTCNHIFNNFLLVYRVATSNQKLCQTYWYVSKKAWIPGSFCRAKTCNRQTLAEVEWTKNDSGQIPLPTLSCQVVAACKVASKLVSLSTWRCRLARAVCGSCTCLPAAQRRTRVCERKWFLARVAGRALQVKAQRTARLALYRCVWTRAQPANADGKFVTHLRCPLVS